MPIWSGRSLTLCDISPRCAVARWQRGGIRGVRVATEQASEWRHKLYHRRNLILMGEPNTALRTVREGMLMSQDELARAVRDAGQRTGEPNDCDKRTVQRWESGVVTAPRGNYARALEYVTGLPIANLGFEGGISRRQAIGVTAAAMVVPLAEDRTSGRGPLTGIWKSRYEYVSSSRDGQTFSSEHYVMVIQRGSRVQIRSLPDSSSDVMMDMSADGQVLTGSWREITEPGGYYKGAVYHGAIQVVVDHTGRRMTGQWAGFNRDGKVDTGPWTLDLVSADTGKDAVRQFSKPA